MKLTGKAKELFEAWYLKLPNATGLNYGTFDITMNRFYCLPESMQWGVYQDWADSIGYDLNAFKSLSSDVDTYVYISSVNDECVRDDHTTRQEARNAAIEKLNELVNGEK